MTISTPPSGTPEASARTAVAWDVLILFALLLVFDTAAQVLFKAGLSGLGEFPLHSLAAIGQHLSLMLASPGIVGGIGALLLAFFTWLAIINRVDLSLAHPVTCIVYGSVPVCSLFFLGEPLSLRQWLGVALIMIGAYVTGLPDRES